MRRIIFLMLATTLLVAGPAFSQENQADASAEDQTATEGREGERQPGERLIDRLRRASRLPKATDDAREAGVPEEEVQEVLSTARRSRVPAGDVETVLDEETRATREGRRTGEFGGLFKQKMDEGLRGRELIEAVRQERAARRAGRPGAGDREGARSDSPRATRQRRRTDTTHAEHDHATVGVVDRYADDEYVDDEYVDDRREDMKQRGGKPGQRRKAGRKED